MSKELLNRNRWLTTIYSYAPNMVLSRDGAWLYLFKMIASSEGSTFHLEIFDTRLNTFLPDKIDLPGCVSATMVPSVAEDGVYGSGDGEDIRRNTR